MTEIPVVRSFIGGEYFSNQSGETFDSLNPATGEVLAKVETAGAPEIELAVEKARAAFKIWKKMTGVERGRILIEAARRLRAENDSLAQLRSKIPASPLLRRRWSMWLRRLIVWSIMVDWRHRFMASISI